MYSFKPQFKRSLLLLIIFVTSLFTAGAYAADDNKPKLTMQYFYLNPCEACQLEDEFSAKVDKLLGTEEDGIDLDIEFYNVFHSGENEIFKKFNERYNVPVEARGSYNTVFIDGKYIFEDENFNKNFAEAFREAKKKALSGELKAPSAGTLSPDKSGTSFQTVPKAGKPTDSLVVYFYVSACSACEQVDKFTNTLDKSYKLEINGKTASSELIIEKYNVADLKNLELARKYFEVYGVPNDRQQVPIAFIGDTWLGGEKEIQKSLESEISSGKGINTLALARDGAEPERLAQSLSGYETAGVFLTGLVNGLNPCSLSMLLFFLSMILAKNVNALKLGFSYIAGKFITYFAIGTLFFNLFGKLGGGWLGAFQGAMKGILLAVVALLVFLNLRDYAAAKGEKYDKIKVQLPAGLRKLNHKWIKKINGVENPRLLLLVSFGLGVVISVGEFLCTGQIYLATIIYVMRTSPVLDFRAAAYFLLYGIALVIPLILLTAAIHKGREIFDVSDLLRQKMHLIKLINAAIFLIFGILILFLF